MVPVHLFLPLFCNPPTVAVPRMCTCVTTGSVGSQARHALEKADVVFTGTVVEIKYAMSPVFPDRPQSRIMFVRAVIVPEQSWKGPVADTLVVWTPDDVGACGFPFENGEEYLVFATRRDSTSVETSSCSSTQRLAGARGYLKALGKPVRRP
jgi:hypothetical protein